MSANLLLELSNTPKTNQQIRSTGMDGIVEAIRNAAAKTGVDFAYLLNKASQESSMNPKAKASSSSATGLYQFVNQTWLQMVKQHGADYGLQNEASAIHMKDGKATVADAATREKILNMRNDPVLASAMAAEFTRDNKDALAANVGGNIGSTELYMAHFLGAGGASQFLNTLHSAPGTIAADLLPDAAAANPSVFYGKNGQALTVSDIYGKFASKFSNKGTAHLMALANQGGGAAVAAAPYTRDLADYSSDFYQAPSDNSVSTSTFMQNNNSTSDTLFNVMLMAQSQMSDSIRSFAGIVKPSNNDANDYMKTGKTAYAS